MHSHRNDHDVWHDRAHGAFFGQRLPFANPAKRVYSASKRFVQSCPPAFLLIGTLKNSVLYPMLRKNILIIC
jgi:hypothetical protein